MATMGFKLFSGDPHVRVYPEGSTQSFKQGDLVKLSSGLVVIASSDQDVTGVALKDATTATTGLIPVSIVDPSQIWLCEADATIAVTSRGVAYGLNIATAGSMSVDISDTTTTSVMVESVDLGVKNGGATTGAGGRLQVRFKYDVCDAIGG